MRVDEHLRNLFAMYRINELEKINIDGKSHRLLHILLTENPKLARILHHSDTENSAVDKLSDWALTILKKNQVAIDYYNHAVSGRGAYNRLRWIDYAAIRILDYIANAQREFTDMNNFGTILENHPIKLLWLAARLGKGGATPDFFIDMIHLFRQLSGKSKHFRPSTDEMERWMERYPSGLVPEIIRIREENKRRIINTIIKKIDSGDIDFTKYKFAQNSSQRKKFNQVQKWWDHSLFHLKFAIRSPELLNEMLDYSLSPDTMRVLMKAKEVGIPFFINPYYLSLLNVNAPDSVVAADLAIRQYVIYCRELVDEFGHIKAWEKEDLVEPDKPNAAGWVLPSHYNIHRRYPEVSILIPDTMGRTCGGLCASCQRMYNFQNGKLKFDHEKLLPNETWKDKLNRLMQYFENDAQIRDILITGGDALMSSDKSLNQLLNAILVMTANKKKANKFRKDGEKHAEMVRVRLGTRLPVYLPQRITPALIKILTDFRIRALKIGIKQFVIQTHFQSPMEMTTEARKGIERLISAGWVVTNQLVFTSAASRRGHSAKLRKVLNDAGVLPYYTFTVKGYSENVCSFAPNARSVQEMTEEKIFGAIPETEYATLTQLYNDPGSMVENLAYLKNKTNLPFLSSDRNLLNMPGVGKSMTFRTIGITYDGRRILEFEHDNSRKHSPIILQMGKVVIIESKSINRYLQQLDDMGEDSEEYETIFGYSICETEQTMPIYEYAPYDYTVTDKLTNFEMNE